MTGNFGWKLAVFGKSVEKVGSADEVLTVSDNLIWNHAIVRDFPKFSLVS